MLCPIKFNSNTLKLIMHTSFYCASDLLRVKYFLDEKTKMTLAIFIALRHQLGQIAFNLVQEKSILMKQPSFCRLCTRPVLNMFNEFPRIQDITKKYISFEFFF